MSLIFNSRPFSCRVLGFFFLNYTATTEIYTLSLHDALPISRRLRDGQRDLRVAPRVVPGGGNHRAGGPLARSEEHTSELQSRPHLVCRLLLEKKKKKHISKRSIPNNRDRFPSSSVLYSCRPI